MAIVTQGEREGVGPTASATPATTSAPATSSVAGAASFRPISSVRELAQSDPYKQGEKDAMKALLASIKPGESVTRDGVTFTVHDKGAEEGFRRVEIADRSGKKFELIVHAASGDIVKQKSSIGGVPWDKVRIEQGVAAVHEALRPVCKAIVQKSADATERGAEASSGSSRDKGTSTPVTGRELATLAREHAGKGPQEVGSGTIASVVQPDGRHQVSVRARSGKNEEVSFVVDGNGEIAHPVYRERGHGPQPLNLSRREDFDSFQRVLSSVGAGTKSEATPALTDKAWLTSLGKSDFLKGTPQLIQTTTGGVIESSTTNPFPDEPPFSRVGATSYLILRPKGPNSAASLVLAVNAAGEPIAGVLEGKPLKLDDPSDIAAITKAYRDVYGKGPK